MTLLLLLTLSGCGEKTINDYIQDDYTKLANKNYINVSSYMSGYDKNKKLANIELVTTGGDRETLYYRVWQNIEDLIALTQEDKVLMENVDYFQFTVRYGKRGPEEEGLEDNSVFLSVMLSQRKMATLDVQKISTQTGEYDPSSLKRYLDIKKSSIDNYPKDRKLKRLY